MARVLLVLLYGLATAAQAALQLSVSTESREELTYGVTIGRYLPLASYLSEASGADVRLIFTQDLTGEMRRTRTLTHPILFGPPHVIGSAVRYGYEPIAAVPSEERVVVVARKDSGIKSLDDLRGKRLGLPQEDSLATYMIKGELNARGIAPKSFFGKLRYHRFAEVALYSLSLDMVDAAAANKTIADKWLAQNPGIVLYETRPLVAQAFAISEKLDENTRARIKKALLAPGSTGQAKLAQAEIGVLRPAAKTDFSYVSTLGYFTPTVLSKATVVSAEQCQQLMAKGAKVFDVRTEKEYRQQRIKGASLLPYDEKSHKEVDFDPNLDTFALLDAVKDKSAPLIFHCNGGECWKSYKAAVFALRHGYTQVHWFRGGIPEWRSKGLPTE